MVVHKLARLIYESTPVGQLFGWDGASSTNQQDMQNTAEVILNALEMTDWDDVVQACAEWRANHIDAVVEDKENNHDA